MIIRDENGGTYEYTECPMCEDMGPHSQSNSGMLHCALCNTTFGVGPSSGASGPSTWLPLPREVR